MKRAVRDLDQLSDFELEAAVPRKTANDDQNPGLSRYRGATQSVEPMKRRSAVFDDGEPIRMRVRH